MVSMECRCNNNLKINFIKRMANNYRESTYSLNMRPAFDPVKFPQTVNTGDYFLSYAPPKTPDQVQPTTLSGVPLPNKYAAGSTARSYAYEVPPLLQRSSLSPPIIRFSPSIKPTRPQPIRASSPPRELRPLPSTRRSSTRTGPSRSFPGRT